MKQRGDQSLNSGEREYAGSVKEEEVTGGREWLHVVLSVCYIFPSQTRHSALTIEFK